jgi:hypothetical protein
MIAALSLDFTFLNECVPLWFALLMAFTTPYMWSRYIKKAASSLLKKYFPIDG